jgi:hypothetical protein
MDSFEQGKTIQTPQLTSDNIVIEDLANSISLHENKIKDIFV